MSEEKIFNELFEIRFLMDHDLIKAKQKLTNFLKNNFRVLKKQRDKD